MRQIASFPKNVVSRDARHLPGPRDELDATLHRIRAERHLRPPVIRCPRCGHDGEAAEHDVTVRAMILSLGRFRMAPVEQVKTLEKRRAAH